MFRVMFGFRYPTPSNTNNQQKLDASLHAQNPDVLYAQPPTAPNCLIILSGMKGPKP